MKSLANIKRFITSRGLPKTGQSESWQTGDDGDYEAGWWRGRDNSNNKNRFITKTINGDDVVIDRATNLMWAADGNRAGSNNDNSIQWGNGCVYANNLNFAGFTDWRIPNFFELFSILNMSIYSPAVKIPPFANISSLDYWSSTTDSYDTGEAWYVSLASGITNTATKGSSKNILCVRKGL